MNSFIGVEWDQEMFSIMLEVKVASLEGRATFAAKISSANTQMEINEITKEFINGLLDLFFNKRNAIPKVIDQRYEQEHGKLIPLADYEFLDFLRHEECGKDILNVNAVIWDAINLSMKELSKTESVPQLPYYPELENNDDDWETIRLDA